LSARSSRSAPASSRCACAGAARSCSRRRSPAHWTKGFLLAVARHLRACGHTRHLTGFGVGSHNATFADIARVERFARVFLPLWKRARFDGGGVNSVGRVHPGFEPPHARLYHLLVREIAGDVRRYFPEDVAPLLSRRHDIDVDLTGLSFRGRLERLAFAHLCSCVDVTRSEKASREAGCARLSPAHFSSTIPYAHFPPNASLSREQRALRPGKLLLRLAYKGVLPDEVLYRKKSWDDAVVSRSWRARGRRMMLRALPH
jgi:hypothetical protein